MAQDPLAVIAESYRLTAETQQILAQTQLRMEGTQRHLARLTLVAALPSVFGLVLLGWVVWQTLAMQHEHTALLQGLRADTETLAVQTQALRDVLRQRQQP